MGSKTARSVRLVRSFTDTHDFDRITIDHTNRNNGDNLPSFHGYSNPFGIGDCGEARIPRSRTIVKVVRASSWTNLRIGRIASTCQLQKSATKTDSSVRGSYIVNFTCRTQFRVSPPRWFNVLHVRDDSLRCACLVVVLSESIDALILRSHQTE